MATMVKTKPKTKINYHPINSMESWLDIVEMQQAKLKFATKFVAQCAGVSSSSFYRWINDDTSVNLNTAIRISESVQIGLCIYEKGQTPVRIREASDLCKIIKMIRERQGMDYGTLSVLTGSRTDTIRRIENGVIPTPEMLFKLLQALHLKLYGACI